MHEFSKQAANNQKTFWKAFKLMFIVWILFALITACGAFLLTYFILKHLGVI